jgi:hypothetical protein
LPSQQLLAELLVTIATPEVWISIGVALLAATGCLLLGVWATRLVGLLSRDAPVGETVSVGLAFGLMLAAAWWAAIWSAGRSSFTPVAIGFALALGLAVATRARRGYRRQAPGPTAVRASRMAGRGWQPHGSLVVTTLGAGLFIVAIALLYGSTLSPSPRDGVQPVEKTDVAFYAVLGRDLATTGTETNTLPSGFDALDGVPAQAWYHWGELWLASAVITLFGTAPLAARYLVVLPILLLAAATMTGTVVRRLGRTTSRGGYAFGFVVCLILTPVPLFAGPFFSVWAAGMIYGIAVFGMAAIAVLCVLYALAIQSALKPSWSLAAFLGSAVAFVLPAHIVIALLGLVGLGVPVAIRIGQAVVATHRLPAVSTIWWRTLIATVVAVVSTLVWGAITDHGLGGGGPLAGIAPFNDSWRDTILVVTVGAGLLLAIPIAGVLARRENRLLFDACVAASVLVIAGALLWGWRLAAFNTFYFFFGAIAVFATPVAAVAVWWLLQRLWATRRRGLAIGLATLCLLQLEFGVLIGLSRLHGQDSVYDPIPLGLFEAIERLPPDAKLAYACQSFEEISFVNSKLLSIDAHTARRIVPMCFEADVNGPLLGANVSDKVPDAGFPFAPQAALYPDSTARPSSAAISAFLKAHAIAYIYADAVHPNSLVPDALPVASGGDFEVLRIP